MIANTRNDHYGIKERALKVPQLKSTQKSKHNKYNNSKKSIEKQKILEMKRVLQTRSLNYSK